MPQIFHRSANTISKLSLAGALMLAAGLILLAMLIGRSSYVTRANDTSSSRFNSAISTMYR